MTAAWRRKKIVFILHWSAVCSGLMRAVVILFFLLCSSIHIRYMWIYERKDDGSSEPFPHCFADAFCWSFLNLYENIFFHARISSSSVLDSFIASLFSFFMCAQYQTKYFINNVGRGVSISFFFAARFSLCCTRADHSGGGRIREQRVRLRQGQARENSHQRQTAG